MAKKNKKLFIISGPSGSGQDSVIEGVQKILPIERVITTTTRKIRPKEKQGKPYYFISATKFKAGIKSNKFFEWAQEYNKNYYGVTHQEIERVQKSKKIGIWKIEYHGVIAAKKLMPDIIAILITAPLKILEQRIRNRDNPTEKFLADRMTYTKEWLKHKNIYDYKVKNKQGKLDQTVKKVGNIIKKELSIDK